MNALISRLAPRSIVARTTLSIIGLALIVGGVFGAGAMWLVQNNEQQRLQAALGGLLTTVDSTAQIASFVGDQALAREIVTGLLANPTVAGARITVADGTTLYEQGVTTGGAVGDAYFTTQRTLTSPFDTGETVGTITLFASNAVLRARAWRYARYALAGLSLEVALIALAVAVIVYNLITRPIKHISDELHQLELRTGMQLNVPRQNEKDEIGRLVSDINVLISRLLGLIDLEHRLRLERETNERRLALIFERVDTGLFELAHDGRLVSWNPAFSRVLGQPGDQLKLQDLLPGQAERIDALIAAALNSGETRDQDIEVERRTHASDWVSVSLTPMEDNRLQGVASDITERKRSEIAAQQLAERNTLTGLLNRRGLDAGLAAAFERRRRDPDMNLAILMIDLDHFKPVNDTYGHKAGDKVLCHVARLMEDAVRHSDLVARPGGDEFTIALLDIDSLEKARAIAESLIERISQPIDIDAGTRVQIGASIGIAMAAADDESAEPVLERADAALYEAKNAGRGQVCTAPEQVPAPATLT